MVYSGENSIFNVAVQQAGFLTYELPCKAAAFPVNTSDESKESDMELPPAAAAFEYSKDWLVTESHRLSFYHA